jgi:hypothetical protein
LPIGESLERHAYFAGGRDVRLKDSSNSLHTLDRDEVAALRKMNDTSTKPLRGISDRGGPIRPDMIARIVQRAVEAAATGGFLLTIQSRLAPL